MHTTRLSDWSHDHAFGQDEVAEGERRTLIVALLTFAFMGIEVAAGIASGSMALLADGIHMGSHAVALAITLVAYVTARRHARDHRFSFGTGKINALGGFSGALLLAGFALLMAWESVERILDPHPIAFNTALIVAAIGLAVNAISALILGHDHSHGHDHDHDHHHDHAPAQPANPAHHHDHNLRSAYLHVLADALTSLTAIFALLAGKYFGASWLDPVMGIVGSLLVSRWAYGLLRDTGRVLLDIQSSDDLERLQRAIEAGTEDRVTDLHLWSIGPGIFAACISLVSHDELAPEAVRARIPAELGIRHATVEIHRCPGDH